MKFIKNRTYYCYEQGDGRFLKWFCDNLNMHHYTQKDLSRMTGISRQHISNVLHKRYKPNKPMVIALCWVFGMTDSPAIIWEYVEEDWG